MYPKPMIVIPGQVNQQKRKVTHVVDNRFLPPIIPKIPYGETSARFRLRDARARLLGNVLELPIA
jgi:hypothetical protein